MRVLECIALMLCHVLFQKCRASLRLKNTLRIKFDNYTICEGASTAVLGQQRDCPLYEFFGEVVTRL